MKEPDSKISKTSLDGRVVYENVSLSGIAGVQLKEVGERVAKEFRGFKVWVTAGPWRSYDVMFDINTKKRIIGLDFYSVRPGLERMNEVISEIRGFLKGKGLLGPTHQA